MVNTKQKTEIATLAAGCFWHVEEAFREVKGVISTTVGYIGGNMKNPSYENVCSDETGHAEAVEIIFDPSIISYSQILQIFWNMHDPTQVNRQGPDFGTQYRSAIFYHSEQQRKEALASKENFVKNHLANVQKVIFNKILNRTALNSTQKLNYSKLSKEKEQKKYSQPIATQIAPATPFYKAEDYHQQYLHKKGLKTCGI